MTGARAGRYGQSRRAGRMLVAKLDYLQLLAVKSVLGWLGRQTTRRLPWLEPPRAPPAPAAQVPAAAGDRCVRACPPQPAYFSHLGTARPTRLLTLFVMHGPAP